MILRNIESDAFQLDLILPFVNFLLIVANNDHIYDLLEARKVILNNIQSDSNLT